MKKVRKIPQRMCVGCREMKDKNQLIRVVRVPEGTTEVDLTGKRSGRGAYLCKNPACLQLAYKSKALQRALQGEVPASVLEEISTQLN